MLSADSHFCLLPQTSQLRMPSFWSATCQALWTLETAFAKFNLSSGNGSADWFRLFFLSISIYSQSVYNWVSFFHIFEKCIFFIDSSLISGHRNSTLHNFPICFFLSTASLWMRHVIWLEIQRCSYNLLFYRLLHIYQDSVARLHAVINVHAHMLD